MKPANRLASTVYHSHPLHGVNAYLFYCALIGAFILGCATQQAAAPKPAPTAREQALIDILSAQRYATTVATEAGIARARDQISEGVYRAVIASGMALDAAWRDATEALAAGTGDLQQRLNVMAEKRRNLEEMWRATKAGAIVIPGKGKGGK